MSKTQQSLSKKLSRRILLLAIPLFALALGTFYHYANDLLEKEAIHRSFTTLNTTEQLVENYLTTIETAAKSNAWVLEEHFTPDLLESYSRRIVELNKSVLSCSVSTEPDAFPEYGRYFSVYSVNEGDTVISVRESEFEYFEKNWYKIPLQTGVPCWINPFSDFNRGSINHHDAVGSYCIPLRPQGSRIVGVVSVDFSFQKLREAVLATHHPYPSSYYMLLGPMGGYLIHPNSSLLFKTTIFQANDSTKHPDVMALGQAMTSGKQGTMHVKLDNELRHVCYMPLADTGWSLALVCNDEDVLKDYNQLTVVMIVIVVIGMLLILWITRRVVQRNIGPLNELMEATEKIAEGNYEYVIPESTHKDVVGKMQNAFHKMQQAILAHVEHIKVTDEEIEKENAEMEKTMPLAKEAAKRKQLFIQNVSRQITTPLSVIEGLAHVLRANIEMRHNSTSTETPLQEEEMHNIAKTLKRNGNQIYRLTLMLYDSSDAGIADKTRYLRNNVFSCNELAKECINYTLRNFHIKDIQLESELADSVCIKSNHLYMMRTLREMLYNAAKYSDGQHITLRITQTEANVRFIIEDIGPGLPEELIDIMYIPFTKTDNLSEGLGLGLPLCKSHVAGLGGELTYDSSYKKGCRFIIELPK